MQNKQFSKFDLKKLYLPLPDSHKGQNGKLLIIGGSKLFHAASLWALKTASRIVDLVHYASTKENNQIVQKLKQEFRNGIVIPRKEIESYIKEDDCILIGPGMVRAEGDISQIKYTISDIKEIEEIEDEGILTYHLTKYLLKKYPQKKWVVDAGGLQMMEPEWLNKNCLITPHEKEFERLFSVFTTSGEPFRDDRSPIPPIPESPFAPSHHPRSQSPPRRRDFALIISEMALGF